jgi:hypothetical protein
VSDPQVNYDRILSGLKEVTAKHDSSSSDSEEERQEAPKKVCARVDLPI